MFARFALAGHMMIAAALVATGATAQEAVWHVQKSSGEVWIAASGAQQVALTPAATVKSGDEVRTGRNGRVLLVRGDESILISPNSAIGLPKETGKGLSTTIIQESGSILLEVEKRSEKHFEVETPYLLAVVKGTKFEVSVEGGESKVSVLSGQVEVADLKSGKYALVMLGQTAKVLANGTAGLSLSGSGTLDAIKQGAPRTPRVNPSVMPREVRANGNSGQSVRIKSALGEVKLDFQKVTKGVARASTASLAGAGRAGREADGKGNSDNAPANGRGNGLGNDGGNGLSNAGGNGLGNGGGNGLGNGGGNGGGNGLGLGQVNAAAGAVTGLVPGLGNAIGKGGCNGKGKSC
jgi:hypothetical protein